MGKTATLYARIEPNVKIEAETILSSLGVPVSNAINMFYKQIILQRGLPFEVKIPAHPLDMASFSESQLEMELEKGLESIENNDVETANFVFASLKKDLVL